MPNGEPVREDAERMEGRSAERTAPLGGDGARDGNVGQFAEGEEERTVEDEVELVIGITRAMGTPTSRVLEQLKNSLENYGYDVIPIKISDLIRDDLRVNRQWVDDPRPHVRYDRLIEHGNQLCKENRLDELVIRAVGEIRDHRDALLEPGNFEETETPTEEQSVVAAPVSEASDDGNRDSVPAPPSGPGHAERFDSFSIARRAYIIDSLKRVEEVTTLRNIYGDHFLLIGFQASEATRRVVLTARFETHGVESGVDVATMVQQLMDKDGHEATPFGQDMLRTFPMADVFIDVDKARRAVMETRRAVALLFGDPEASVPTPAEFGMQLANQVQTRSPELGLRVGAAILNRSGDVLAMGTNQHPTESGSPDYDAGAVDLRHLATDTLERLAEAGVLSDDAIRDLATEPDKLVDKLFAGKLKESELRALTEYQRPVHAEMNALISALRQGVTLDGATVYVTAYPCHNCAKHLIAVGLKVVYLSPYAKSKASAMYGKETKRFTPFTGVAPRRYESFFIGARTADRKNQYGERLEWTAEEKRVQEPKVTAQITMRSKQTREDLERRTR